MRRLGFLFLSCCLTACSLIPGAGGEIAGPTPIPAPSPAPLPAAEVTFRLAAPPGTATNARLSLVVLDEVAGYPFNQRTYAMRRQEDGRYEVTLTPPVGSLVRYRYHRDSPSPADESTARGETVSLRLVDVAGPTVVDDLAAAWADTPYLGPSGRIIGHISDALTGAPLPEILVNASGVTTFTDGEGYFRLDGLAPGMQLLVAMSLDGAYRPWQQNALVAAESATPADFAMTPAQPVTVAFEVTVPSDTPIGGPLRLAGNLRQLGDIFHSLPGGVGLSAARMPVFTMVDATHYILITSLYAGTDLRYAYTLGDGMWNAERSPQGDYVTRQWIVPAQDAVAQDVVSTWHGGAAAAVTLHVRVPDNTPASDSIGIQFNPYTWFEPVPMVRSSANEWTLTLFGPFDLGSSLGYRYCRNLQCGAGDDADTSGPDVVGRPLESSDTPREFSDTVRAWEWWGSPIESVVVPGGIQAGQGFEAGVEFLPAYRPAWSPFVPQALGQIASGGANAVILTPAWTMRQNAPAPVLAFDPSRAPFRSDLAATVSEAHRLSLLVSLHPSLQTATGDVATWWASAPRDLAWWDVWFESYRSLVVTYARLATETGADKLVIGGPEATPALPGGLLADGSPAGGPADAEARWRALIADVRAAYRGPLAFEIEVGRSLQPPPPFLDAVDEVHVYWHAALGDRSDLTPAEMQAASESVIQRALLAPRPLAGKPILLSVEYLSVDGAATACAPAPDGSCRPASAFDAGAVVDPDLPVDLTEQAQALNAVLTAAYAHPEIVGFYARGYNPAVALQDKSASVNGKPARDVLWYWYSSITGR